MKQEIKQALLDWWREQPWVDLVSSTDPDSIDIDGSYYNMDELADFITKRLEHARD